MNKKPGVIREDNDSFSLFDDGRKMDANKRRYVIKSVQQMFASPKTQELLRLGEATGFYGHTVRERAGGIFVPEQSIVMLNGKPVVIENVPSNRTTKISCSDDGIVAHTQEVLGTPSGLIVDSMLESQQGGWSWATAGSDGYVSHAKTFAGCDYVLSPNFISLNHESRMLEAAGERNMMMMESLQSAGYDKQSAERIISMGSYDGSNDRIASLESDVFYLQGLVSEKSDIETQLYNEKARNTATQNMLLESLSRLPIYMTDDQKRALSSLETEEDREVVCMMLESMMRTNISDLPLNNTNNSLTVRRPVNNPSQSISYSKARKFPS